MTKEQIIEACSDELNRYFILSSVELEYYCNYANYESIEMINGLTSKGEYEINFRFEPSSYAVITAGNIIHGKQLIMKTKNCDLVIIIDKGKTKLSEQLTY
jgi:hypothetical protein